VSVCMAHAAMSMSNRTLDVLLDHLRDVDRLTILARTGDQSEPYC